LKDRSREKNMTV